MSKINKIVEKKDKSPIQLETVSLSLLYLVRTPCVRAVAVGTPLKNVRSCVRAPRDNQVGRDSTRKAKGLSTIYFLKKEKILPSHPLYPFATTTTNPCLRRKACTRTEMRRGLRIVFTDMVVLELLISKRTDVINRTLSFYHVSHVPQDRNRTQR